MAIKWISSGWKTHLETALPGSRDDRLYIDFRREEYPEIAGSPTYTLIASGANQSGSHNLTGGYARYLLPLQSSVTVHIKAYPQFEYDTGDDQPLWGWADGADRYLKLFYDASEDKFRAEWKNGGTARYLESGQFDDGSSYTDIDQWLEFTFTADLTTGDTSGAALYVNGTSADTAWSDAIDSWGSYNFNTFDVRAHAASAGDYHINHCRIFFATVTSAQVTNRFKDVKKEEVFFPFNGCALGSTRCNISRASYTDSSVGFVRRISTRRGVETSTGMSSSNTLDAELNNIHGEFSTDQYAAFDPTQDQFNGTSAQKYLRNRCGIMLESWYGTDFDYVFVGKIADDGISRTTPNDKFSTVRFSAEDSWSDVSREIKRRGRSYENKKISDGTEADSLVHLIARLATQKEVYNYASNSSFENATIGNSWTSTNCTLSRSASNNLFGTYSAEAIFSGAGNVLQIVTFTGTEKLSVGQSWTYSAYIKCADPFEGDIVIYEADSLATNDSTSATVSIAGGEGYKRFSVTHEITDTDSDRLFLYINSDAADTIYIDGAMLSYGSTQPNFWVLNNNDGASAIESADDADYASYDTVGFDVDAVDITHPWAIVEEGVSIGEVLTDVGLAVAARYMGIDSSGTLKLRTPLKTGYSDPTPIETVDDAMDVSASMDYETANKIIGHGIKIVKEQRAQILWSAEQSGAFDSDYANFWGIDMADGDDFPDPDEFGEFWAKLEILSTMSGSGKTQAGFTK